MKYLLIWGWWCGWAVCLPMAFANDVAVCDPTDALVPNRVTRVQYTVDVAPRPGFLVYVAPTNQDSPAQVVAMNTLKAQMDALAQVPHSYWMCADTNADGTLDGLREMTQAEKDTLEAPETAARQRQQAFQAEVDGNPFCTAELTDLDARIDAAVDAAPSTVAGIKALLKTALKRITRCVRARAGG